MILAPGVLEGFFMITVNCLLARGICRPSITENCRKRDAATLVVAAHFILRLRLMWLRSLLSQNFGPVSSRLLGGRGVTFDRVRRVAPRGGGPFYPRGWLMGGGNSKCPSLGVSFSLDRDGERCVLPLPLWSSVSGFVPQNPFCAVCQCQFQMLSRSPETSRPIPHATR